MDTIEALQGTAFLASELETEILPARVSDYEPGYLDTLMAAGEVTWLGLEQIGDRNGRIALYLTGSLPLLRLPDSVAPQSKSSTDSETETSAPNPSSPNAERVAKIAEFLSRQGASFFSEIHTAVGGGFPGDTVDALWELVWAGRITNYTFYPLRRLLRPEDRKRKNETFDDERPGSPGYLRRLRSRTASSQAHGRWSLLRQPITAAITPTQWSANMAQQLLQRHGILMRESAIAENIPGGYQTVYPALKTMEDTGWVRRGMFVAGLGAAQFAMPAAVDMLRSLRVDPSTPEVLNLAATDPANPYGALLPWPKVDGESADSSAQTHHSMARTAGASVILINGQLAAFLRRRNPSIRVFLLETEPDRGLFARELSKKLAELAIKRLNRRQGLLIGDINGAPAREHVLGANLQDAGFVDTVLGYQMRRKNPLVVPPTPEPGAEEDDDEDSADIQETA
jgi:ATP-dependent Lhr-like helicase